MEKLPDFEELNKEEKIEEVIEKPETPEVKLDSALEKELEKENTEIKNELEQMPVEEREKIGVSFHNFGFFAKELKSQAMAWIFENAGGDKKEAQETEGFTGSVKRWLNGYAQSYRKDEAAAKKNIETTKEFDLSLKQVGNVGFITGEAMKYGRTVADVIGWTAGSPLRYVMLGAQIFSRGAEAAKEARLMNVEVIEKTRIKDVDEAADEAWKIYENAQAKAEEKGEKVSKQNLEKTYVENLPEDLLKRLEKSEPGMATGILQRVLKKDLEFAIKHGKVNESRLKEYDKMISQYGEIDALAMGAKYAETAGKAIVAGVQIETAALLFQRMPEMINKLMELGSSTAYGNELPEEILKGHDNIEILKGEIVSETEVKAPVDEKLMELATIKKGEGIEHALIRQLMAEPEKFEFKGNAEDLKSWAGGEAHRIAIKSGYVDINTGEEIRIGTEGRDKAAYMLEKEGNEIKIKEYFKGEKDFDLKEEHIAAKDYKSAKFEGVEKESYEYIEKPKVKLTPEKMAEMADKEYIIEESYSQRIAEQERLKEIERAEMREKLEYYDERYNEQERLKEIEIQKASELKIFAADLAKEYPKGVKVNIDNDALLAMKERGIDFQKGKLTNLIGDKGEERVLDFEPIGKQITQKIDVSKEGDNLLVKVTDTDRTVQKLYITDQNRLGILRDDFESYKKLAETAASKPAAVELPKSELDKDLELVEKGISKKQPEIDQSWTKGLK